MSTSSLPLGVRIHDTPEKVLMRLLSRDEVVDAFMLGRLIERACGPVGDANLADLDGVTCGTYSVGGMLSKRAGVFVVRKDGTCFSAQTVMS